MIVEWFEPPKGHKTKMAERYLDSFSIHFLQLPDGLAHAR